MRVKVQLTRIKPLEGEKVRELNGCIELKEIIVIYPFDDFINYGVMIKKAWYLKYEYPCPKCGVIWTIRRCEKPHNNSEVICFPKLPIEEDNPNGTIELKITNIGTDHSKIIPLVGKIKEVICKINHDSKQSVSANDNKETKDFCPGCDFLRQNLFTVIQYPEKHLINENGTFKTIQMLALLMGITSQSVIRTYIEPDISIKVREPISRSKRFEVLKRDNFKCQYCGVIAKEAKLHIDHIIPVSKGGTNEIDNLATACESCNLGKSNK